MPPTFLITGASGFVARFLLDHFRQAFEGAAFVGLSRQGHNPHGFDRMLPVDLLDAGALRLALRVVQPTHIVHLAAESSVGYSWKEPAASFLNNGNIYLNLLEAIRAEGRPVRLLSVGSSEEYGDQGRQLLYEDLPASPHSPYAVARAAQTHMNALYAKGFGLDIVSTRSFNHFGPGQTDRFVVSAFCRRFALLAKQGADRAVLKTGNLEVVRDFTDVRDVVRAYALLLRQGQSGRIYNVCSSRGRRLGELVDALENISGLRPRREVDPAFIRPDDPAAIVDDNTRIRTEVGWLPEIPLERTLEELYRGWLQSER